MKSMRWLVFLLLCTTLCAWAKNDTSLPSLPTRAAVQQSLNSLAERNLPEAEQNTLKAVLEKTLQNLEAIQAAQQSQSELAQQIQSAPQTIKASKTALSLLESTPAATEKTYSSYTLERLEALLSDKRRQLSLIQNQLSEANSIYISAQSRPERAQTEINRMLLESQQISSLLSSGKQEGKVLSKEARAELTTEQALLHEQSALLKAQLQSNDLLLDLGTVLRDLQLARSKQLDVDMLTLQNLINQKRRTLSEKEIEKFSQEAQSASPDSLLALESAANVTLSTAILETTDQLNALNKRYLEVSQQLDDVQQAKKSLEENINALQGSMLLAKILYQQKKSLEDLQIDRDIAEKIADIRLRQFDVSQQREQLSNPEAYVQKLSSSMLPETTNNELNNALLEQVQTRYDLLERYSRELNALLNASIGLQVAQSQLLSSRQKIQNTLEEQMFWVPSNKPLSWSTFIQWPAHLSLQFKELPLGKGLSDFTHAVIAKPWLFIPVLLLIGLLLWQRTRLKQKLLTLNKEVGHFKKDSQWHTPLALLLNVLLSLPVALLMILLGVALHLDGQGQNVPLASAFYEMAKAWLILYTTYCLLRPNGIAERHFHWPEEVTFTLFNQTRWLSLIIFPLLAIATIAEHQPEYLSKDSLGLFAVILAFGSMTVILWRLLLTGPVRKHYSIFRQMMAIGLTLLPLSLVVAIGLGYYYTALKLTDRLINTFYVVLIWIVVEAVLARGLAVAARRLAYQRAAAMRAQTIKEGGEGGEFVHEPTLDLEQVNEQSMRLIRVALYALLGLGLYWVWADLLTVFSYLDHFTLYEYSSGIGATATLLPLSLGDLIGALLIVAVTILLALNLPGLLEVLVLSKLELAQGTAYAATTLLSYSIFGIGTVSTLAVLGVSWDKLQWLVAALSLGIGFGMQEIFANFISGLIILFERPIRIGDTVTIGTLSGTVSRIQIRATTITDFDRKEIIVPNKAFITGQLINWSLTDTVTRVVLSIGLSGDTDTQQARALILQVLKSNPRVLNEPAPHVFFMNITSGTFNYDIRFFVREVIDRLLATDEVLTKVTEVFRTHGIEIASNQMEVHVKKPSDKAEHVPSVFGENS